MLTECPDCGKYFSSAICTCGYAPPRQVEVPKPPPWSTSIPPCTWEENKQARAILCDVAAGMIDLQEAHRRLAALFGGREVDPELGCGLPHCQTHP